MALESNTEEYRIAQGKLNTAFETAGYSAEAAQEAYTGFYGILGDTDTATEASQLLAQLAENEQDVSTWTNIAAGVYGTFGDSLPIEGLIEASNETAKVGQVTGALADALNWVGISEDEFNAKLAECTTESERNQLIMQTLNGTYSEASQAFYANNSALVENRNNQALLQSTMAQLGGTITEIKTRLMSEFLPGIAQAGTALVNMINGVQGADVQFSQAINSLVTSFTAQLPNFLNMGIQILTSIATGILQSLPTLIAAVPQIISSITTAVGELLPTILQTGTELLNQFTTGIETGLPDMVSRIPQIIEEFLNYITSEMPNILSKGTEMLNSLVNGILEAIPAFVSELPQIITSFANFISQNLPQIVQSGIKILTNLITGIIKAIPQLVAALPQIIFAIVKGIGSLMGSIINIGADIVRGIWKGIQQLASWLWGKVTGFFSGIVDGVKNFLGINSPSKVFAGIGGFMAEGLGEGWDDEYANVKKNIENGMTFKTAKVGFEASATGKMQSALTKLSASIDQGATIVVNSVLDGKIIGKSVTKYQRNAERAYT